MDGLRHQKNVLTRKWLLTGVPSRGMSIKTSATGRKRCTEVSSCWQQPWRPGMRKLRRCSTRSRTLPKSTSRQFFFWWKDFIHDQKSNRRLCDNPSLVPVGHGHVVSQDYVCRLLVRADIHTLHPVFLAQTALLKISRQKVFFCSTRWLEKTEK